jgi:riboflavin synthase
VFTGIIEALGRVVSIEDGEGVIRIALEAPSIAGEVALGDSIAINGACLTVVAIEGDRLAFDAVRETLEKTSLGALELGDRAQLERALEAGGRLDGHIVQGHVDEVGRVDRLERDGDDVRLRVACSEDFAAQLVDKGSVAIDGVSLTVVTVERAGFHVVLIPHTLALTTLGDREVGSSLNLEADILGKYVKRYLDRIQPGA